MSEIPAPEKNNKSVSSETTAIAEEKLKMLVATLLEIMATKIAEEKFKNSKSNFKEIPVQNNSSSNFSSEKDITQLMSLLMSCLEVQNTSHETQQAQAGSATSETNSPKKSKTWHRGHRKN